MTTPPDPVLTVLRATLDALRGGSALGVVAALADAAAAHPDSHLIWSQALTAINSQLPAPWPDITAYSADKPTEHVVALLGKTIDYVEAVHQ